MNQITNTPVSLIIPSFSNPDVLKNNLFTYDDLISHYGYEVIIVDDAQKTPFTVPTHSNILVIRNEKNSGVSYSRNKGIEAAKNEIMLFIDDDIEVSKENIIKAVNRFTSSNAFAFSCMHSSFYCENNFPTRYKSFYMNNTFHKASVPIGFIYGSLCGLKGAQYKWNENIHYGEDTFLATEIVNDQRLIDFYKDIEFNHYKAYTFVSLIKNDFLIPFHFAKSFIIKRKRELSFSHTNRDQLLAISCIPFISINFLFLVPWAYFNRNMYQDYPEENKVLLTLFIMLDQFIMGIGIFLGLIFATCNLLSSDK